MDSETLALVDNNYATRSTWGRIC